MRGSSYEGDLSPYSGRIANTSPLRRRSPRPWARSPRHKLPYSDTGRPRSRCHNPSPSQLERSLDRVDRHERLGTEPVSGSGHAALQISDRMGEVYRGWEFALSLPLWQDRADVASTSGRAR